MKGNASFNHYRPARYFAENIDKLKNSIPETVTDTFEKVFLTLNSLIK